MMVILLLLIVSRPRALHRELKFHDLLYDACRVCRTQHVYNGLVDILFVIPAPFVAGVEIVITVTLSRASGGRPDRATRINLREIRVEKIAGTK